MHAFVYNEVFDSISNKKILIPVKINTDKNTSRLATYNDLLVILNNNHKLSKIKPIVRDSSNSSILTLAIFFAFIGCVIGFLISVGVTLILILSDIVYDSNQ